ncbi:MAG TPA: CHASE2 domain-containing protein [Chthoniobacteraceae bacterium]|jgi:CHASE2 domain-containing sensor protein|nr:CHASE2 domain-containing protein [Chthoniobacteraceae bacterium]
MRNTLPQCLFAVLAVGVLLLRESHAPPLAGIEETFINWLAANSDAQHGEAPVTLVEINDNSMLYYPLPWSPLNYADFLDGVLQFQARVAAVEPVLIWNEKTMTEAQALEQPQYEKLLHYRILQTPKIELGALLGVPEDPDVIPPMQPLPALRNVQGPLNDVPEFTVVESEPDEDLRLTAGLGFTNVPRSEATAEHAPMVFRYRGELVPSFALEAMMLWHGVTPDDVEVRLGDSIRLGNKLTIPVNDSGAMLVDWRQPYDRAGFDDLVLAQDQLEHKHTPVIDPAKLKDRMVILARTDHAAQTLPLPTGRNGSSGELFAAAIATAEAHAFARPAGWEGSALVLALGVAMGAIVSLKRRLWVPLMTLGFGAGYLVLCLGVFEGTRIALPLTPMMGLVAFIAFFRLLAPGRESAPAPEPAPADRVAATDDTTPTVTIL